jgi:hypothetical protein
VFAFTAAATFAAPYARAQQEGDAANAPDDGAFVSTAAAADAPEAPPPPQAPYSQPELDQMLAPIALYPDDLLAQILMAATYPLEVVQAARWSRSHPGARGENAVALIDNGDWDPSVKSLVAFPEILSMMDEKLDWTQRLGEAFLADQASVMGTVQKLRRAASDAGNLASNDEMNVSMADGQYAIAPAQPDEVFMPYYDPRQIYGPWWWPADPPVYWAPFPGYGLWSGYGYCWAPAVVVSTNFFFGGFDWHSHHAYVHDHRPFYYHGRDHRAIVVHNGAWQHDPVHRRNVQYTNPILRTQYSTGSAAPAARVDRVRTRTNEPRPGGANPTARLPAERTVSVPQGNPVARTDRQQQGFFPAQRTPAPQTEAQAREVPNTMARPPAYVQHYARPPVDAPQHVPQVHYANPAARAPEAPVAVAPGGQPVGRVAPQASAPVAREGSGEAHGNALQRGGGGPEMHGATQGR